MTSSIHSEFNPPEHLSKEQIIDMARRYIKYWRIEAQSFEAKWELALTRNSENKTADVESDVQLWDCYIKTDPDEQDEDDIIFRKDRNGYWVTKTDYIALKNAYNELKKLKQ